MVGSQFKGIATAIGDALVTVLGDIATWVQQNQTLVVSIASVGAVMMGFAAALLAIGTMAKVVLFALLGLKAIALVGILIAKLAWRLSRLLGSCDCSAPPVALLPS